MLFIFTSIGDLQSCSFHLFIIRFLMARWNTHPPAGGFGRSRHVGMGISYRIYWYGIFKDGNYNDI